MSKVEQREQTTDPQEDIDLKGTLFGVAIVGFFILFSWFGVWALFLSR